eukprot:247908_1
MELDSCLSAIWCLPDEERNNELEFTLKVLSKVIRNPNESKYRNLNLKGVLTRLNNNQLFVKLLHAIGFERNDDGSRLILNQNKIRNVKQAYDKIVTKQQSNDIQQNTSNDPSSAITELMNSGLTEEEAIEAVQMSFESPQDIVTHTKEEHKTNSTINNQMKKPNVTGNKSIAPCLCGNELTETLATSLKLRIFCDSCHRLCDGNCIIYHCDAGSMDIHPQGYDICECCASKPIPNPGHQQLTNMGFASGEVLSALHYTNGDVNAALESLLNGSHPKPREIKHELCEEDCNYSVQECPMLSRLRTALLSAESDETVDIATLIGNFHHLLMQHDSDRDFHTMFREMKQCGSSCDISTCPRAERHLRNRALYLKYTGNEDGQVHQSVRNQIIDKMHCYVMHLYDTGCRWTLQEKELFNRSDDDEKSNVCNDDGDDCKRKRQLLEMRNMMKLKHDSVGKSKSSQKFNTDLTIYSFGQTFYYWKAFNIRKGDTSVYNVGYNYNYWYITKKYDSFKEEMLNCNYLTYQQWENELNKALLYKDRAQRHIVEFGHSDEILKQYEIMKGAPIPMQHLIAVIIYCGYDNICREFRTTFRRLEVDDSSYKTSDNEPFPQQNFITWLDNKQRRQFGSDHKGLESDESLKERHRCFYHFARYLHEAVTFYSKEIAFAYGRSKTFYHGISEKLLFDELGGQMNQPLSTTAQFVVAMRFAEDNMVLTLNAHPRANCFDCAWISDYPGEREYLFFSCPEGLHFANITIASSNPCAHFPLEVQALRVIDKFSNGIAYEEDNKISAKMLRAWVNAKQSGRWETLHGKTEPVAYGAQGIHPKIQRVTNALIEHELNRSNPDDYGRCDMHSYIERLLHNICIKKNALHINWTLMNAKIINKYDKGYQGYLFLKERFCLRDMEMINLDVIYLLFPNVKSIRLFEISGVTTSALEHMGQFVLNKASQSLGGITLELKQNAQPVTNAVITAQISLYQNQLMGKGWYFGPAAKGWGAMRT